jgi:pimeloyl-ACP methyl ester carboxylesterase
LHLYLKSAVENSIEHDEARLNYIKSGNGPECMLLFHGFGQDHRAFNYLMSTLYERYTFFSFDLFFHGKSEWKAGEQPLEKEHWVKLFHLFLEKNNIERFSLTGFSMGCRFILPVIEAFPNRINKIFLIAPDGIKASLWYLMSTYPLAFRKIFKSMINHPRSFRMLANALRDLHLMDKGLLNFAEQQMNTAEKRSRVYHSWVVFRHLRSNLEDLAQIINANNIQVTFISGKQDRVIKANSLHSFVKHLKNCRLQLLDAGHRGILKDPALPEIVSDIGSTGYDRLTVRSE